MQILYLFGPRETWADNAPKEAGSCFPYSPRPCEHFRCNGSYFENLLFWEFLGFQSSRFPGSQISRVTDFRMLVAAIAASTDELSDTNLTSLPNAPQDQISSKEPRALAAILTEADSSKGGSVASSGAWNPKYRIYYTGV